MQVPDVWGQGGAIFAFSAIDGRTDWAHPFVASTSPDSRGLEFHTHSRAFLNVEFPGSTPHYVGDDSLVAGDAICSTVTLPKGRVDIQYLFLDCNVVVGRVVQVSGTETVVARVALSGDCWKREAATNAVVLNAGNEGFTLVGKGRRLRSTGNGLEAELSGGEPLIFALLYSAGVTRQHRRALSALSVDQDALLEKRRSFFAGLPVPHSADALLRRAYYKCASVQKVNCCTAEGSIEFNWTTPDRWPHRHMWIWDSGFHALGLRHFAPRRAQDSIKAVLSKQRANGFVPHMMAPDAVIDSMITQPPVLAWAAWRVYERAGDEHFIGYCYPRLKSMIQYDLTLDKDGDGLVEWESAGASGMDNSPRFDCPPGAAVDFNSYLANEAEYLALMAERLGLPRDACEWRALRCHLSRRMNERLWDEVSGFYYDLDSHGMQVRLKTVAGFTPMFAGISSDAQAAVLVRHLTDPCEFRRGFPVPSVAADEACYSDDMWRGPAWVNFNYMVIEGLLRYGYGDLAAEMRETTLREIARWYQKDGVIYEYYDSECRRSPSELSRKGSRGVQPRRSAIGRCIRDYHWTAALYVDLMLDSKELHRKSSAPR